MSMIEMWQLSYNYRYKLPTIAVWSLHSRLYNPDVGTSNLSYVLINIYSLYSHFQLGHRSLTVIFNSNILMQRYPPESL